MVSAADSIDLEGATMTSDYSTLSTPELLALLERAGYGPHPDLIRAIYERRETAEGLALDLFIASYNDRWPDDDPRWYRFLHAGKLLIAWRTEAALPVFARLYLDDSAQDDCEWFENDPAHNGPAAAPYFAVVVRTGSDGKWHYGRALAAGR